MSLSIKTSESVITTLTKTEQDNPTPLERGILLKDCLHKKLGWEPYTGEMTKDFIYHVRENGTIEQLPLTDFKGYDLKFTYKEPKEGKV